MLTAGWRKIGATMQFQHVAALQDMSKAHRPPQNSDWMVALKGTEFDDVARAFNCLKVADPELPTDHLGLASEVLSRIWEHHPEEVLEIMKPIQEDLQVDVAGVTTYLFWCASGSHGSVAMATLATIFLQEEGFEVLDDMANRPTDGRKSGGGMLQCCMLYYRWSRSTCASASVASCHASVELARMDVSACLAGGCSTALTRRSARLCSKRWRASGSDGGLSPGGPGTQLDCEDQHAFRSTRSSSPWW